MPEWLLSVYEKIKSVRAASVFFISTLCLVFGWGKGYSYLIKESVSEDIIPYFLISLSFSFSYLLVELLLRLKILYESKMAVREEKREKEEKAIKFRNSVVKSIPEIPKEQLDILVSLVKSTATIKKNSSVRNLVKAGFIYEVQKISTDSSVFELAPVVKTVLVSYLKEKREYEIKGFIEEVTKNEKYFLSVFFCETIPFGVPNTEIMAHDVYQSGVDMRRRGILTLNRKEDLGMNFRLPDDVSTMLMRYDIFQLPVRTEILLDPEFIASSGLSGGGAGRSHASKCT